MLPASCICGYFFEDGGVSLAFNVLIACLQALMLCVHNYDPIKEQHDTFIKNFGLCILFDAKLYRSDFWLFHILDFTYLLVATILGALIATAEPPLVTCTTGHDDDYYLYNSSDESNPNAGRLFMQTVLALYLNEGNKINVYRAMKAYREKKPWSEIFLCFLRLDMLFAYLVLIFIQGFGSSYLSIIRMPYRCCVMPVLRQCGCIKVENNTHQEERKKSTDDLGIVEFISPIVIAKNAKEANKPSKKEWESTYEDLIA